MLRQMDDIQTKHKQHEMQRRKSEWTLMHDVPEDFDDESGDDDDGQEMIDFWQKNRAQSQNVITLRKNGKPLFPCKLII